MSAYLCTRRSGEGGRVVNNVSEENYFQTLLSFLVSCGCQLQVCRVICRKKNPAI